MERHRLTNIHIMRLAGIYDNLAPERYRNGTASARVSEKIESALIEWERQVNENRCRLLSRTQFAYLYCNQN